MTAAEILKQLQTLGTDGYKRVLLKHGIPEPVHGVKIEELKKIQKRVRKDYQLALDLYDSGIYDARYLAGLIADESRMTRKDLRHWLSTAGCDSLVEYTVAWVTAESRHGRELAMEWIESRDARAAAAGWATLGGLVAITQDADLDLAELRRLLRRVERSVHEQPNRVRYVMNGFVIALGCYVRDLTGEALEAGVTIGSVSVDMGGTACRVPYAPDYIQKVRKRGTLGRKRATVRC